MSDQEPIQKTGAAGWFRKLCMGLAVTSVVLALVPLATLMLLMLIVGIAPTTRGSDVLDFFLVYGVRYGIGGYFPAAFLLACIAHIGIRRTGGGKSATLAALAIVLAIFGFWIVAGGFTLRDEIARDDSWAMMWLRSTSTAQKAFHTAHGRFAKSFHELNSAKVKIINDKNPPWRFMLDGNGKRLGWYFALESEGSHYTLTASPISLLLFNSRHLYTDETGVIRRNAGSPAGPASPPIDEALKSESPVGPLSWETEGWTTQSVSEFRCAQSRDDCQFSRKEAWNG